MPFLNKIFSQARAKEVANEWKAAGKTLVFTNGCFDILHPGHVHYLEAAKSMGDYLMVGLNSDASVRLLGKGPRRPINSLSARAAVLAALESVDAVVAFDEETPLILIELILPHVLCKGGDYTPDRIVGSKQVLESGGRVEIIPFVKGFSTTALIQKLDLL